MKKAILSNWSFSRALRMVMGIVILYQAITTGEILIGLAGLLFTAMAVFNAGCCGSECYVPLKKEPANSKEVTYDEIV
ncbi:hypothetical protein [Mucilaginibacter xinganensis]|uniref:DUF2892 domain-containing protein n=1 Tax=Mucilaginibacter xinganensis TaxID=1234841 RepID=A0A223P3I4_9SPHI|nr:hypothetical protein [Mucilaginibacter xinganensis]ASU36408.1 hypothetical protein MuYL_4523 [Mucilaginibacter xinganensis]